MRRALAVLAAAVALGGCADVIDTELGLDAAVDTAAVTVSGGVVSGSFDVSYRVGEHAEGVRSFRPQAISLFVAGAVVGTIVPTAEAGFDPMIAPGESRTVVLSGDAAGVSDPNVLCGAEVTLVLMWTDRATGEMGMHESTTTNVTCS